MLAKIDQARIKRLRETADASQRAFAQPLDVSRSTVQSWESEMRKPSGIALKLLAIVEKHGLQILA